MILSTDVHHYPDDTKACLLCTKGFSDQEPIVLWRGSKDIYVHGGCAGTLVLRLARDAWQVERDADDGAFSLTPHTKR